MSNFKTCVYTWRKPFSDLKDSESDEFSNENSPSFKLIGKIYGVNDDKNLYLHVCKMPNDKLWVKYVLNVKLAEQSTKYTGRLKFHSINEKFIIASGIMSYFGKCHKNLYYDSNGYSIDNSEVQFEISVDYYSPSVELIPVIFPTTEHKCYTTEVLNFVMADIQFSDLKIKVQDFEFNVHRIIVAAKSPVLRAALIHDTYEKQNSIIEIPNFDKNIIRLMIDFMYKNYIEIPNLTSCKELLKLSDIYDIKDLQQLCTEYLQCRLSSDNVIDIFVIADTCNAFDLRKVTLDYFVAHLKTCPFKDLKKKLETRPDLLMILLEKIIVKYTLLCDF